MLLGWPSRELTGGRSADLGPAEAPAPRPIGSRLGADGGAGELLRRDGARFPIEYTATPAEATGARTAVVVTFRDVTARHRRERERDAELAELRAMRATLVPAELPQRADLRFATCFVPAMSGVAGDFYLVTAGPGDTTVVVVGDVSGKGVAAAQCAAFVRTSLATFAPYTYSPSKLLELANSALLERGHDFEMLVTAACAVVDPAAQTVTWSLAGHPPPHGSTAGRRWRQARAAARARAGDRRARGARAAASRRRLRPLHGRALRGARARRRRGRRGVGALRPGTDRRRGGGPARAASRPTWCNALRTAAETFTDGALSDDLCIVAFRSQATRAPAVARRLPIRPGRVEREAALRATEAAASRDAQGAAGGVWRLSGGSLEGRR